jgi:hypothetical protein
MSRLVSLEAENLKRLRLVRLDFDPETHSFIVAGRNAQGKTSILDTIAMVLGGEKLVPERPIRAGAKSGRGTVVLDNGLQVTRKFTSGGSRLEITGADGAPLKSPQAILDKLVGRLGLDPLEFIRQDRRKQLETLKRLVGLDFTVENERRRSLYEQRTGTNRQVAELEARLRVCPMHADAPAAPVSIAALVQELRLAEEMNRVNAARWAEVGQLEGDAETIQQDIEKANAAIVELEKKVAQWREYLGKKEAALATKVDEIEAAQVAQSTLHDLDTSAITERIAGAEEINKKVAANQARAELVAQYKARQASVEDVTRQIDAIDEQKGKALAEAHFPIPGLSFDDDGILYQGVSFDQASSAEQLKVATAIAFALTPDLPLVLIRDGSLLDDDSLRVIDDLAEEKDGQVLIERVGSQGWVVLEDGEVVGTAGAPAAEPPAPTAKAKTKKQAASEPPPLVLSADEIPDIDDDLSPEEFDELERMRSKS